MPFFSRSPREVFLADHFSFLQTRALKGGNDWERKLTRVSHNAEQGTEKNRAARDDTFEEVASGGMCNHREQREPKAIDDGQLTLWRFALQ